MPTTMFAVEMVASGSVMVGTICTPSQSMKRARKSRSITLVPSLRSLKDKKRVREGKAGARREFHKTYSLFHFLFIVSFFFLFVSFSFLSYLLSLFFILLNILFLLYRIAERAYGGMTNWRRHCCKTRAPAASARGNAGRGGGAGENRAKLSKSAQVNRLGHTLEFGGPGKKKNKNCEQNRKISPAPFS